MWIRCRGLNNCIRQLKLSFYKWSLNEGTHWRGAFISEHGFCCSLIPPHPPTPKSQASSSELTRLFRIKFFIGRSYPLLFRNPGVAWEDQVLASNGTVQYHFLHIPVRCATTPVMADTQLLYLQESSGAVTIKPLLKSAKFCDRITDKLVFKPRSSRYSFFIFFFFFYSFCRYECLVVNHLDERGRGKSCSISWQILSFFLFFCFFAIF